MQPDQLVLGIDGGATKTVAWLACCRRQPQQPAIGRGSAGPANPQAVTFDEALRNLDRAVLAAFDDAAVPSGPVAAAVLAVAGSDRPENRQVLQGWAQKRRLARRFRVVHDGLAVLAAGTPQGWGIALVAGTGSLAFGQTSDGRQARAGGWGYLFGDEGSGYAVALAGLQAAAKSADGRGPQTRLLPALLARLDSTRPPELIAAVYQRAGDRAQIASLAQVVVEAAGKGDAQAQRILDHAADELSAMVAAVAHRLHLAPRAYPLALAGGLLVASRDLQRRLQGRLEARRVQPAALSVVADPVLGAVELARSAAQGPAAAKADGRQ